MKLEIPSQFLINYTLFLSFCQLSKKQQKNRRFVSAFPLSR